jgi:hypothetical protein
MSGELERIIVNHCSPVLLGCKPAALFRIGSPQALAVLSRLLRPRIDLKVMRKSGGSLLVMVFESGGLEKTLLGRDARAVLSGMGYPRNAELPVMLDFLRRRFNHEDFPHEIGFFLGYPVEDVLGFVRHQGRNYKFCGYWKVYGDVEHAKQCFSRYDACREYCRALYRSSPPPVPAEKRNAV